MMLWQVSYNLIKTKSFLVLLTLANIIKIANNTLKGSQELPELLDSTTYCICWIRHCIQMHFKSSCIFVVTGNDGSLHSLLLWYNIHYFQLRKFVQKYSSGLRARTNPSLQSEQIGVIPPEGIIAFVDEVSDMDKFGICCVMTS